MSYLLAYYIRHNKPYIDHQFSRPDLRPICVSLFISLDQLFMKIPIHVAPGHLMSLCEKKL